MTPAADSAARERRITRTSFLGIASNVLLAGFKAVFGLAAGSVAIVLDAVNNLTDALSSVVTILGVKLARRPPNAKHPFGYGRIEYFSAVAIASLVLAAGAGAFVESVRKIVRPEAPDYGAATLVVVAVAVVAKFLLGRYVSAEGRACNSEALAASGADATFDALVSSATLAGAGAMLLFGVNLDGWIGAGISLFIVKAGIEMLSGAVAHILGRRPDADVARPIREAASKVPGVIGVHDLILHNYGPDSAVGSLHVELDGSMSAADAYRTTHAVQAAVFEKFRVVLTVGIYAIDPARRAERELVARVAEAHPGVMGVHGLFFDDVARTVYFDVLCDFTVRDRPALREALVAELSPHFPGRTISIVLDADYAD